MAIRFLFLYSLVDAFGVTNRVDKNNKMWNVDDRNLTKIIAKRCISVVKIENRGNSVLTAKKMVIA